MHNHVHCMASSHKKGTISFNRQHTYTEVQMSQTTQPMFLNGFLNACHNLVFIIIMRSVSLIDQYLGNHNEISDIVAWVSSLTCHATYYTWIY